MRHLTRAFALGALRRGKQIEQFLGGIRDGDRQGIRWVALGPGRNGIVVYLSEVEDAGTDTFWDITEFPPLDPDGETWGKQIAVVTTPEEALDLTERELGARPDRWVNQGVAGSEYGDYRAAADSRPRP
jgi:hypothetical protein